MNLQAAIQRSAPEPDTAASFSAALSPASFWLPDWIGPSAWIELGPFAFWLVDACRPATLVELGTHHGYSYLAFCQAVQRLGLDSRCYAVDLWTGDEHAGRYGDDVLENLRRYHDPRYGAFSSLVRSTFDDVLGHFLDGSIDLLHIDGRHYYDDVRHDFESWRPKLSDRAVVLFHDTNVRERDFGVFRLWDELRRNHPHFELVHGHGLGVLGIGASLPGPMRSLFEDTTDGHIANQVREAYARLGGACRDRLDFAAQRTELSGVRSDLAARTAEAERLRTDVSTQSAQAKALSELLGSRLEASATEIKLLGSRLEASATEIKLLGSRLEASAAEIERLQANLVNQTSHLERARRKLRTIRRSAAWRLALPARLVERGVRLGWRRLRKQIKRLRRSLPASGSSGEPMMGRDPRAERFDEDWYLSQNPDVRASGVDAFHHYINHGAAEGREAPYGYVDDAAASEPARIASGVPIVPHRAFDPTKECVMIVSHEASRSGAPILAFNLARHLQRRYDVVLVTLGGGDLVTSFKACSNLLIGPLDQATRKPHALRALLGRALADLRIKYAIVNSIQSRCVLDGLSQLDIPAISLIHEFAAYVQPKHALADMALLSGEIVFPAAVVRDSALEACPSLAKRVTHIIPQGRSDLPTDRGQPEDQSEQVRVRSAMAADTGGARPFVVVGCGTVNFRKGVDLFLSCAMRVRQLRDGREIRFVWIGGGYDPEQDLEYSAYLKEQMARAALAQDVAFLDEVSNLDQVFRNADLLLLSSRLDPLPNVAIDAMSLGVPVVCFAQASGIAGLLEAEPESAACVVPYLDVAAAAERITAVAADPPGHASLAQVVRRIAATTFQMDGYVDQLDALGSALHARRLNAERDVATIQRDPTFDPAFFLPEGSGPRSREQAVRLYLKQPPGPHRGRKPFPGFHPGMYAEAVMDPHCRDAGDPFADFVRRGKPAGPWLREVMTPTARDASPSSALSFAMHIHVHYPELLPDIIQRLAGNVSASACDLLISVDSEMKAAGVARTLATYRPGHGKISIFPNRGRDIGAMITGFGADLLRYDLIAHIHTKRSAHVNDQKFIARWRELLLESLLGGRHRMMDQIVARFADDARLGFVYPDDPHIVDWSENKTIAAALAPRLGLSAELPVCVDFPVGTMFWARPTALQPVLEVGMSWDDYPPEPIHHDGTILHALERLLPLVALDRGFQVATTHVPGVGR